MGRSLPIQFPVSVSYWPESTNTLDAEMEGAVSDDDVTVTRSVADVAVTGVVEASVTV